MFIDLFGKLIDRLLDLARERERRNQHFFENIVQPVHTDFEAIHSNYISSFQAYQDALYAGPSLGPGHPVFSLIVRDSLSRQTLRNRLEAFILADTRPEVSSFRDAIRYYLTFGPTDCNVHDDGELAETGEFPIRFRAWLTLQRAGDAKGSLREEPGETAITLGVWENTRDYTQNIGASWVAEALYRGAKSTDGYVRRMEGRQEKIQKVIADIDSVIQTLQVHHSRVMVEYEKLRVDLLSSAALRPD